MDSLRKSLASHCHAHNLPVPNDDIIEDQICKQLAQDAVHWCVDAESGQAQEAYTQGGAACRMTFMQVLNGTRTIGSWLLKGRQRVEHVESERRARICATCPQNQEILGCSSCSMPSLRSAIEVIVGGARTSSDDSLHGCCVCGCSLKALIHIPLAVLQERMPASENKRLPDHCWKKRIAAA